MKEHPILFTGEMVRAILDGRKTQTRRVVFGRTGRVRFQPLYRIKHRGDGMWSDSHCLPFKCPYGVPGDHLWVRETFSLNHSTHVSHKTVSGMTGILYRESWSKKTDYYDRPFKNERRWRPSIHMPRWASRLTLKVTDIRVERVQEISEADAMAEGAFECELPLSVDAEWPPGTYGYVLYDDGENTIFPTACGAFKEFWNTINAKRGYGLETNPWVWVVEFRCVKPGDET